MIYIFIFSQIYQKARVTKGRYIIITLDMEERKILDINMSNLTSNATEKELQVLGLAQALLFVSNKKYRGRRSCIYCERAYPIILYRQLENFFNCEEMIKKTNLTNKEMAIAQLYDFKRQHSPNVKIKKLKDNVQNPVADLVHAIVKDENKKVRQAIHEIKEQLASRMLFKP